MKAWIRLSIVCAALLVPGLSHAAPRPDFKAWLDKLRATVPIPAGWDGIYDHLDSVYICGFGVLQTSRDTDTVCVNQEFQPPLEGSFTCTGSSTSTTFHVDCNGTSPFAPGCDLNITGTYDGVKNGTGYDAVGQITGTDNPPGCVGGTICLTIHVHATRLGDSPPAYCATPTLPRTWGSVKATYR